MKAVTPPYTGPKGNLANPKLTIKEKKMLKYQKKGHRTQGNKRQRKEIKFNKIAGNKQKRLKRKPHRRKQKEIEWKRRKANVIPIKDM